MIVYLAVNKATGMAYVGQTSMALYDRIYRHKANRKKQHPLCLALREHGIAGFDFAVLEQCESRSEAIAKEQQWISDLGCRTPEGYNVSAGDGALGVRKTIDAKRRIGAFRKKRWADPEYRKDRAATHWTKSPNAGAIREALRKQATEQHRRGSLGSEVIKRSWITRRANKDAGNTGC